MEKLFCKTCTRQMKVPLDEYQENPHCRRCLNHRLKASSQGTPIWELKEDGREHIVGFIKEGNENS